MRADLGSWLAGNNWIQWTGRVRYDRPLGYGRYYKSFLLLSNNIYIGKPTVPEMDPIANKDFSRHSKDSFRIIENHKEWFLPEIVETGGDLGRCRSRSGDLECSGCDRTESARSSSPNTWIAKNVHKHHLIEYLLWVSHQVVDYVVEVQTRVSGSQVTLIGQSASQRQRPRPKFHLHVLHRHFPSKNLIANGASNRARFPSRVFPDGL